METPKEKKGRPDPMRIAGPSPRPPPPPPPPPQQQQQQALMPEGWELPRREPDDAAAAPLLVFAPLAWLKLQFFLHAGDTEVGGFAVTAGHDPLYVEEFATVAQRVTAASVEFDDAAVADYFDQCVDAGLPPGRFARVWCHTHPADCPRPSLTDEHTFARVFGGCDWSVMFILSRTGRAYARRRFGAGPGGAIPLNVAVDWAAWPQLVLEGGDRLAGQAVA